jgi:protoporphyrinogen oxidase
MGRVQNYKNWSRALVPRQDCTSLGVEFFTGGEDALWTQPDGELIELALRELEQSGLAERARFRRGFVVRVPHAYPVYGPGHEQALAVIREFLEGFKNLQVMGRAGLFRYNNSDHALLTGLFAARNLMGAKHDLWAVDPDNGEAEVP